MVGRSDEGHAFWPSYLRTLLVIDATCEACEVS